MARSQNRSAEEWYIIYHESLVGALDEYISLMEQQIEEMGAMALMQYHQSGQAKKMEKQKERIASHRERVAKAKDWWKQMAKDKFTYMKDLKD